MPTQAKPKVSLRQHSVSDDEEDRRSVEKRLATCEQKLAKYKDLAKRTKEYIYGLQKKVESGSGDAHEGEGGTIKARYTGTTTLHGPGSGRPLPALLKKIGGRTKRRRRGGRTKRRRRGGRTKRRRRGGRTKRRCRGGRRRTRRK